MARDLHVLSVSDASDPLAKPDRLGVLLKKASVAYGAGGGAGAAVTAAVAAKLPAKYAVFVGSLPADATAFVTSRTTNGFTVSVQPRLASATLAAGSLDLLILY